MAIRPDVTYTPCATSSRQQTGDIIKFTNFWEGNILTKNRNNAESDNDDSIMPVILSKEDMDAMDSGDESTHDPTSTEMLEEIHDWSQTHPKNYQREPCYKIHDCIRRRHPEWKWSLRATQNMGKGLHEVFKTVV